MAGTFGRDYYDYVNEQRKVFDINFTTDILIDLTKQLRAYNRELKKAKVRLGVFNVYQRIQFRRKYMKLLFDVDVPEFQIEKER